MSEKQLTHLDARGAAHMVDVSAKPIQRRTAIAEGFLSLSPATLQALTDNQLPKGEALAVARIAGISAAKRTGDLIPLCHPLGLDAVSVDFELPTITSSATPVSIRIIATATVTARTGVEMEALTAVSLAALTLYDMCKAIDKSMTIQGIRLISKSKTNPPLR